MLSLASSRVVTAFTQLLYTVVHCPEQHVGTAPPGGVQACAARRRRELAGRCVRHGRVRALRLWVQLQPGRVSGTEETPPVCRACMSSLCCRSPAIWRCVHQSQSHVLIGYWTVLHHGGPQSTPGLVHSAALAVAPCSRSWAKGVDVALPGGCRTPLGLIDEGGGLMTLLFTRRAHSHTPIWDTCTPRQTPTHIP